MNSISTFGSYAVADSGQSRLAMNSQTEQKNVAKTNAVLTGDNIERQVVEISQEALAKFQAYTAKQKMDDAGSEHLRTAEGAKVGQFGRLSEEEQTGLMEAMAADSLAEYLRVANETWGNLSAVTKQMDQTYSSFLDQLAEDHPDLKGAFFGFSVNKDGTLFVTQSEGLDREQIDRLEKALNGSDALVSLANDLADAQIAVFNAQRGFNTQQTLNRDNYGQTIDMGIDILTRHLARSAPRDGSASEIHQRNWDSNWYNQL
ncbi:hypothetical protein [Pectobacterium carotovorum]|uniref:hypothetical protein n=1 Tax=Pectobacterium carotovorum TaxID=554 RepID=UPI00057CAEE7|nr:hypothetical protein [Pectobacterium carotovorum]KHT33256.1 hypothetical protein RC99_14710 [Pectobacterium carotovorum subsp. carotovorum]MCA6971586.1 hypothetical protein [Pectobacterium carotovorum]RJL42461.1 hypothetical protein D5078_17405 [Pectobacterium carotovorum]